MMVDTASSRLSGNTRSRVREGQVQANTVQWAKEMHRLLWEHAGGVGLGTSLPDKEQQPTPHCPLSWVPGTGLAVYVHHPTQQRCCDYLPHFKYEDVEAQKA